MLWVSQYERIALKPESLDILAPVLASNTDRTPELLVYVHLDLRRFPLLCLLGLKLTRVWQKEGYGIHRMNRTSGERKVGANTTRKRDVCKNRR